MSRRRRRDLLALEGPRTSQKGSWEWLRVEIKMIQRARRRRRNPIRVSNPFSPGIP
jgi:hypothetical protein